MYINNVYKSNVFIIFTILFFIHNFNIFIVVSLIKKISYSIKAPFFLEFFFRQKN